MGLEVSHIVNSIFSSRTYVLRCEGNSDVWLVDCGDVEKLPADCNVKGVLLTHAHFDHIYGLPKLLERFPDCWVVTSACGLETIADASLHRILSLSQGLSICPGHEV